MRHDVAILLRDLGCDTDLSSRPGPGGPGGYPILFLIPVGYRDPSEYLNMPTGSDFCSPSFFLVLHFIVQASHHVQYRNQVLD